MLFTAKGVCRFTKERSHCLPAVAIRRAGAKNPQYGSQGHCHDKNQTLAELYAERKDFYEKYAEIIINCSGLSIEESVQKVCVAWQNYQQNKQV